MSGSPAAGCGLGKRAVGAGFPRTSSPDGTLTDHAVQYGFDPQTGRLNDIIHGDTDFGIPERAFVQSYLAHSHLPDTLTAPLHQTVRTWEVNRDALKSIRSATPGAGGTNFLTAAYGDANFAVNGIGQRTSADYSGEIYQSLYSTAGGDRETPFSPPSGLPQRLFQGPPAKSKFLAAVGDLLGVLQGKGFGREIWKLLAIAAFILFLLESVLARWVSRNRRAGEETRIDFGQDAVWATRK